MKPKLYIFLWFVVGAISYYFTRLSNLEANLQWFLYFNLDDLMDILIVLALLPFVKSWKVQYQLMVYAVLFSKVLDLLSTIIGGITGEQQQGQWIEIFSHVFAVISIMAISYYIIENKSTIARTWAKLLQKLHGR